MARHSTVNVFCLVSLCMCIGVHSAGVNNGSLDELKLTVGENSVGVRNESLDDQQRHKRDDSVGVRNESLYANVTTGEDSASNETVNLKSIVDDSAGVDNESVNQNQDRADANNKSLNVKPTVGENSADDNNGRIDLNPTVGEDSADDNNGSIDQNPTVGENSAGVTKESIDLNVTVGENSAGDSNGSIDDKLTAGEFSAGDSNGSLDDLKLVMDEDSESTTSPPPTEGLPDTLIHISNGTKRKIIAQHNDVRSSLTRPIPAYMEEVEWSEALATRSAHWAKQCRAWASAVAATPAQHTHFCGQNLYWYPEDANQPSTREEEITFMEQVWDKAIRYWSLSDDVGGDLGRAGVWRYGEGWVNAEVAEAGRLGQWTQMVWPSTNEVGCAVVTCEQGVMCKKSHHCPERRSTPGHLLVCSYCSGSGTGIYGLPSSSFPYKRCGGCEAGNMVCEVPVPKESKYRNKLCQAPCRGHNYFDYYSNCKKFCRENPEKWSSKCPRSCGLCQPSAEVLERLQADSRASVVRCEALAILHVLAFIITHLSSSLD